MSHHARCRVRPKTKARLRGAEEARPRWEETMAEKKATRTAVTQQPTKKVNQQQLAEILRLRKENKRLTEKATAEETKAAKKKQLEKGLWEAKAKVRELKAELDGGPYESLEGFAYWAWRYAAPLLKSISDILERFDRGSVGDIEEHREEIAHAVSYALTSLGDELKERARVATGLI